MKKIIFLFILGSIGFSMTAAAQKAISSVHFFDIKDGAMEKNYIASLKEINAIIKEIGFPNNYYRYSKLAASDTNSIYRNCTIGHWTSEKDYKTIHDHPKFKAWSTKNKDVLLMSNQLYRRFYAAD